MNTERLMEESWQRMEAQRYWSPMAMATEAADCIELAEKYEFGDFKSDGDVSKPHTLAERVAAHKAVDFYLRDFDEGTGGSHSPHPAGPR